VHADKKHFETEKGRGGEPNESATGLQVELEQIKNNPLPGRPRSGTNDLDTSSH